MCHMHETWQLLEYQSMHGYVTEEEYCNEAGILHDLDMNGDEFL